MQYQLIPVAMAKNINIVMIVSDNKNNRQNYYLCLDSVTLYYTLYYIRKEGIK